MLCTHTGLHWHRRLPSGRDVVNVGVIGRPANDGATDVWCARLTARPAGELAIDLLPLPYDHVALAREMRAEELPGALRRDHRDRLVDHLPRDPSRQGARPGAVLGAAAQIHQVQAQLEVGS